MKLRIIFFAVFIFALFFLGLPKVFAEVIVLTDGTKLYAEVIAITGDNIQLDVQGEFRTYPLEKVYSLGGRKIVVPPKINKRAVQPEQPVQEELPATDLDQLGQIYIEPEQMGDLEPVTGPVAKGSLAEAKQYFEQGLSYALEGDEERALEKYKQALAIKPGLGQVYLDDGITYYFLGQRNKARQNLQKASELFDVTEDYQRQLIVDEYMDKLY